MSQIIDFHAHAFPDQLAVKSVPILAAKADITAVLDGTITSLLHSMDRAKINKSVVASVATRPAQFDAILAWSKKIRSERIEPFLSFHPENPDMLSCIEKIKDEGFKGIKLHPYYQKFAVDEERLFPAYEKIADLGLILLMHSGFDIGFPGSRIADPVRTARVIKAFPDLKFIAAHMGGWQLWDEVREFLVGKNVYLDLAFCLEFMTADEAREIILGHPMDKILFGSDTPWADQQGAIAQVRSLNLGDELEKMILGENGAKLLKSV